MHRLAPTHFATMTAPLITRNNNGETFQECIRRHYESVPLDYGSIPEHSDPASVSLCSPVQNAETQDYQTVDIPQNTIGKEEELCLADVLAEERREVIQASIIFLLGFFVFTPLHFLNMYNLQARNFAARCIAGASMALIIIQFVIITWVALCGLPVLYTMYFSDGD